jgi:hypothetical protein
MSEGQGGLENPSHGEITSQRNNQPEQVSARKEVAANTSPVEQAAFYQAFWNKLIDRSSNPPILGQETASYPIKMLNEFEYFIATRNEVKKPEKRIFADKLALIGESIRKVKTAYEIITFPYFKDWGIRDSIKDELERDRNWRERDSVELNNEELEIVRRLCQIPRYELHAPRHELDCQGP